MRRKNDRFFLNVPENRDEYSIRMIDYINFQKGKQQVFETNGMR